MRGALSHIEVSNYLLLQGLLSLQMFAKNSIGQPSGPRDLSVDTEWIVALTFQQGNFFL